MFLLYTKNRKIFLVSTVVFVYTLVTFKKDALEPLEIPKATVALSQNNVSEPSPRIQLCWHLLLWENYVYFKIQSTLRKIRISIYHPVWVWWWPSHYVKKNKLYIDEIYIKASNAADKPYLHNIFLWFTAVSDTLVKLLTT